MKKLIVTSLILCFNLNQALATISVIDSANLSNSAKQVTAWAQQLEAMKRQLEQAKQQYIALTGNRNLGQILYNSELRNKLPAEYQAIYNMAGSSNYGISGSISDIINLEKLSGSTADMQKNIEARSARTAATNKAVGLKAYAGANKRLLQIEALMNKINETQDLKAINELQARIAIEQAAIQNEMTKLQMIGQLQAAEQHLINEQKLELSRRLLNSTNTEMPRIK